MIPGSVYLYQYIEEFPHMFDTVDNYRATMATIPHMSPAPQPPVLPRILEKVIVNNDQKSKWDENHLPGWDHAPPAGLDDNSILAVPNHVVLNHLTASAIKNGTLGVGTTTRYRKKVRSSCSEVMTEVDAGSTSRPCFSSRPLPTSKTMRSSSPKPTRRGQVTPPPSRRTGLSRRPSSTFMVAPQSCVCFLLL